MPSPALVPRVIDGPTLLVDAEMCERDASTFALGLRLVRERGGLVDPGTVAHVVAMSAIARLPRARGYDAPIAAALPYAALPEPESGDRAPIHNWEGNTFSTAETGTQLGVGARRVGQLAHDGTLGYRMVGGNMRITDDDKLEAARQSRIESGTAQPG